MVTKFKPEYEDTHSIREILNQDIVVTSYRLEDRTVGGNPVQVALFTVANSDKIYYTFSNVVIDAFERYKEDIPNGGLACRIVLNKRYYQVIEPEEE